MNNKRKCIIGIIIVIAAIFLIGTLWTTMETTTNMERINITKSCSLEVPKDMEFDKSGGIDSEGAFIGLNNWKGGNFGKLWIDYEQPNDVKIQGDNSTEPFDVERKDGNPGTYSCMMVVDKTTNQKVVITGENPTIVKKVAKSVRFTNNTNTDHNYEDKNTDNNSANATVEHINSDASSQQSDNQQSNNNKEQNTYVGKDGKTHTMEEAYSVDYSSGDLNTINQQRRERGMSEISA